MLITVDRKIATRADEDKILADSYALEAPFGIPTVVITPEELAAYAYYKPLAQKGQVEILQAKLEKRDFSADDKSKVLDFYKKYNGGLSEFFDETHASALHLNKNSYPWALPFRSSDIFAHQARNRWFPILYKEPHFNLIFPYAKKADFKALLSVGMPSYAEMFPDVKSFDGTLRISGFWHEAAHGAGAGEPQADMIAALVTKKVYQSSAFITFWADFRAAAVMLFESEAMLAFRGWPTVLGNDIVAAMPQKAIDAMDEEAIKEYRFSAFDHKCDDVLAVRKKMGRALVKTMKEKSLAPAYECAAKLERTPPRRMNEVQLEILSRFRLAVQRLMIGEKAYEETPNLTPL